jgi:hypothetical protein
LTAGPADQMRFSAAALRPRPATTAVGSAMGELVHECSYVGFNLISLLEWPPPGDLPPARRTRKNATPIPSTTRTATTTMTTTVLELTDDPPVLDFVSPSPDGAVVVVGALLLVGVVDGGCDPSNVGVCDGFAVGDALSGAAGVGSPSDGIGVGAGVGVEVGDAVGCAVGNGVGANEQSMVRRRIMLNGDEYL